jgi:methylmalonyl-CoA decarboxylase
MSLIAIDHSGSTTTLTMSHSRRLNALGSQMVQEMVAALESEAAERTRAFVIRAEAGARTWSAGHDVNELPVDGGDPLLWTAPLEQLLRTVHNVPFPVIAAVEGGVWGGACDLVSTCDLVVATQNATFAITPAKLGVPYNTVGVSHFLNTMPLHIIKEMFFTAEPISAQTATQHGLVNRLVDDEPALTATAAALAERLAQMSPLVVRALKAELGALTDARPMTPDVFERLTMNRQAAWRSRDYAEGIAAFRQRRPAEFSGE